MSSVLRLIYFNAKGHAELPRWIMAYGGIPYVDDRVEMKDWPRVQKYMLTGSLPTLVASGRQIPGPTAISRYLAKKTGLVPQNLFSAAMCDAVTDRLDDIMDEIYKIMFSDVSDDEKHKAYEKYYTNEIIPSLKRINGVLDEHHWLVSEKLTWGDMALGEVFNRLPGLIDQPNMLKDFPNIRNTVNRVLELPGIKEWNEKQPKLPY